MCSFIVNLIPPLVISSKNEQVIKRLMKYLSEFYNLKKVTAVDKRRTKGVNTH